MKHLYIHPEQTVADPLEVRSACSEHFGSFWNTRRTPMEVAAVCQGINAQSISRRAPLPVRCKCCTAISTASQVEALHRYIHQQGWTCSPRHDYRDEGISGARLDRPALDRLRDAAQRG